jgi:SAM-dependent methyltransferase
MSSHASLCGQHGVTLLAEGRKLGTKQDVNALRGIGLLQSNDEWHARNIELASALRSLIATYLWPKTGRALDVGCMAADLTPLYGLGLPLTWIGIDPDIPQPTCSKDGIELLPGFAHQLDYAVHTFDCITFANVYEHVTPALRHKSVAEIYRVLTPGGILVGQLPNPYFPIESHSRLPFFGYVPRAAQRWYWKLSPTGWDYDRAHFFSVTVRHLRSVAEECGFTTILIRAFNYSPNAIPISVRWLARLHSRLPVMPWAWQFVFRKPIRDDEIAR